MNKLGDSLTKRDPVRTLASAICKKYYPRSVVIEELSLPAKRIFLVESLMSGVLGEGFWGYLHNVRGANACETLSSLKEIKAFKTADLLSVVINCFRNGIPPSERLERTTEMELMSDRFLEVCSSLDNVFYIAIGTHPEQKTKEENLWQLCLNYIDLHKNVEIFDVKKGRTD